MGIRFLFTLFILLAGLQALYLGIEQDRYTLDVALVFDTPVSSQQITGQTSTGRVEQPRQITPTRYEYRSLLLRSIQFDLADDDISGRMYVGSTEYNLRIFKDTDNSISTLPGAWFSWVPALGVIFNLRWGLIIADFLLNLIGLVAGLLFVCWCSRYNDRRIYIASICFVTTAIILPLIVAQSYLLTSALAGIAAAGVHFSFKKAGDVVGQMDVSRILVRGIFIVLLGLLASNVFLGLSQRPFHQDENFHVAAAAGYNETGRLELWDFWEQETTTAYTRNSEYTRIVAGAFRIFGISEGSARVSNAVIAFIGGIFLAILLWKLSGSPVPAMLGLYLYAVNDVILYFARFVRGYMILMLLTLTVFFLLWLLVERVKKLSVALLVCGVAVLLFAISIRFHATAVFQIPIITVGIGLYVLRNYDPRKYWWYYFGAAAVGGFLIAVVVGAVPMLQLPFSPQGQMDWSIRPQSLEFAYYNHVVQPFNFSWQFLVVLSVAALPLWKQYSRGMILLTTGVFFPIIMSTAFFDRYEDFRYIAAIQPLVIVLTAVGLYGFYLLLTTVLHELRAGKTIKTAALCTFICTVVLAAPMQIPGMPAVFPFIRRAQADWQHYEGSRIHRRAAQPDNHTVFSYIFTQAAARGDAELGIIRVQSDGMNWLESYYIHKYLLKYPDIELTYRFLATDQQLETLLPDMPAHSYVIASIAGRLRGDQQYLTENADFLSDEIGVVPYRYGYGLGDGFYPYLWRLHK